MFEIRLLESISSDFLSLRHRVLRSGQPFETVHYDVDSDSTTSHIGYFERDLLVGCSTLQVDERPCCRFRIRGMAVDEKYRGRGIGTEMVRYLQSKAVSENSGIWCNARILAVPMYERCGFRKVSSIFEIKDIGLHYDMEWHHG